MPILRSVVKAVLPPSITVRLRAVFKHHEQERDLLPALCDSTRDSIDVGAALGAYTWPLVHLTKKCTAFEPMPEQAAYLRRAFGKRIRLKECALSNCSGETELVVPLGHGNELDGQASINPNAPFANKSVRRVKVAVHPLDSFDFNPVGFIKIDVEGHELAVLEGAQKTLRRDKPILLIEVEDRFAPGSIERVRHYLAGFGYRGQFLEHGKMRPIEAFDPSVHQAIANFSAVGRYINNFIFVVEDGYAATQERLARHGYPALA